MGLEGTGYLALEVMECGMAERATVSRAMDQPDMAGAILPEARIMEAAIEATSASARAGHPRCDSSDPPLRFRPQARVGINAGGTVRVKTHSSAVVATPSA